MLAYLEEHGSCANAWLRYSIEPCCTKTRPTLLVRRPRQMQAAESVELVLRAEMIEYGEPRFE